jgi:DNA-binding GntR family transcriptional regulator
MKRRARVRRRTEGGAPRPRVGDCSGKAGEALGAGPAGQAQAAPTYGAYWGTATVYHMGRHSLRAERPSRRFAAVSTAAKPRAPSSHVRPARSPTHNGKQASPPDARSDHVSRVYNELRGLIISGQLPPGARIAERAVVDRLGSSRTPVRSALHRLQQEGFVASSRSGRDQRLIVTPLTQSDGIELLVIVGHLEGLAAREAASLPLQRRRPMVRKLREINRALAVAASMRGNYARAFELDLEFHRTYVEDVVGPRLLALHNAIKPQSERYTRLYVTVLLDELPTSVKEHETIIRAIASGDPAAAQAAVETNWRNASRRLAKVIADLGERGIWHLQ